MAVLLQHLIKKLKKTRPYEAAEDYIDEIINMLLHINNNSQINIMDRSLGNKIVEKTSPISSSDNVQIHPVVENKTKVCTVVRTGGVIHVFSWFSWYKFMVPMGVLFDRSLQI